MTIKTPQYFDEKGVVIPANLKFNFEFAGINILFFRIKPKKRYKTQIFLKNGKNTEGSISYTKTTFTSQSPLKPPSFYLLSLLHA